MISPHDLLYDIFYFIRILIHHMPTKKVVISRSLSIANSSSVRSEPPCIIEEIAIFFSSVSTEYMGNSFVCQKELCLDILHSEHIYIDISAIKNCCNPEYLIP